MTDRPQENLTLEAPRAFLEVVEEGFQNPVQDIWVEFAFHFDEIGLKDE
jgi:hypothetical protein